MIYKRCGRCGKRLTASAKCDCVKKRHREYDKYTRNNKVNDFYHSNEWLEKREDRKRYFNGIDIYSYYVLGVLEYGRPTHHIVELKEDWSKRLDDNNLILLTEKNHQDLHERMRNGEREVVVMLLKELLKRYKEEFKM